MNKLMARIFAVVMVIVMLGTVSFAATLTDFEAPDVEGYENQTTKTVLAFATNVAGSKAPGAGDEIIAIEQLVGIAPTSLNIDETKIADKDYIVIIFSGDQGKKDVVEIDKRDKEVTVDTVTLANEMTIDGVKYKNVALAECNFTTDGRTVNSCGFIFKDENGENKNENKIAIPTANMTFAEGASFTFRMVLLAVPEDASITAKAFVEYK